MLHQTIAALLTSAVSLWQLPGLSQGERYIPVGIDEFNRATVYLDLQSLEKIDSTSYKYTIFSSGKEHETGETMKFEEDIAVNCNQLSSISHLGSRLYNSEGRLIKTDRPSGTQSVSASSGTATYFNANRMVCDRKP
jgi:ribosomal protein S8